jgi:NAD(P)-dependent dehydrogenase (short-subunit alcohol dehydrogenase family)
VTGPVPGLLDGVRVVITGASRGIGQASAQAMAAQGAQVVAFARTEQDWVQASTAGQVHPITMDVSEPEDVSKGCDLARGILGSVDVLINNAGVPGPEGPLWEADPYHAAMCLAINTLGPFHLLHELLPAMVVRGSGVVINVSSGQAERPKAGKAWYGATKAALDHLVAAAAMELDGTGVRIHSVHPGPVDTALNAANRRGEGADRSRLRPPAEVAALITWLASAQGAQHDELFVRWRDPEVKARLLAMPGYPEPIS